MNATSMSKFISTLALLAAVNSLPVISGPAQEVLFEDNFSGGLSDQWQVVSGGDKAWRVADGTLVHAPEPGAADAADAKPAPYACITAGELDWDNYIVSAWIRPQAADWVGLLFRYSDPDNHYRLRWGGRAVKPPHMLIEKIENGETEVLASKPLPYLDNYFHEVKVFVEGGEIAVFINDIDVNKPVLTASDRRAAGQGLTVSLLDYGQIGLLCSGGAGAVFDNVAVYEDGAEPSFPACSLVPVKSGGVVFCDANANGVRDEGEDGIAGVVVSDGLGAVKTGADGRFEIGPTDPLASRFLFVVVPSGYRDVGGWYRAFPGDGPEFTVDFALAPAPETANPDFTFAHVTDLHIGSEKDLVSLAGALETIRCFGPAFIVDTGDFCNSTGHYGLYASCRAAFDKSPLPVRHAVGNHDGTPSIEGIDKILTQEARKRYWTANFEDFFGPAHYSFDYGGRHFVILLAAAWDKAGKPIRYQAQDEWLRRDLELQPPDKEILLFQHVPPDQAVLELLAGRKGALFSGHWHSTKVLPDSNGAPFVYINTPPLLFGGIDASPRGFRLVRFQDGKMTLEYRFMGLDKHCAVITPAEGSVAAPGAIAVRAAAYDSGSPQTRVECRLDDGAWQPLDAAGKMTWQGQVQCDAAGEHTLAIRADFGADRVVEKSVRFSVAKDSLPELVLGGDWPMFRRDAANTGIAEDDVLPPLRLAWSRALGGTAHFASPVVANGTVYMGVADEDLSGRAGVYALDARTGDIRWHHPTRFSVRGSAAVDGKRVFAGSTEGLIFALDSDTGDELWRYSLGGGVDRWFFSSPVPYKGVVYAGSGPVFAAIDAATGKEIWRNTEVGTDWISSVSVPAVIEEGVYGFCNWCDTGLYGLRRESGEPMWAKNLVGYGSSYASPVVADNILYFPARGRGKPLQAVNPGTGEVFGGADAAGLFSAPLIHGERLVLADNCLTLTDRSELWKFPAVGNGILGFAPYTPGSRTRFSPALSGNILYSGANDGMFCAVSIENGAVLWRYDLGQPISSSPAISGNTVFIGTYDGLLCAFTSTANH